MRQPNNGTKESKVDGITIRQYLRERRKQLDHDKEKLKTATAKRSVSSAKSELMFVEEYLNKIDPVGKKMFEMQKSYK